MSKIHSTSSSQRIEPTTQLNRVEPIKTPPTTQSRENQQSPTRSSREQLIRGFQHLGIDYRQLSVKSASTLDERYKKRRQQEARRAQQNLEEIFKLALDYAPASTHQDSLDFDWLHTFTEHAQQISNPAMQQLWARILATESAKPGSFAVRTLVTLRRLTTRDADSLARAQRLTAFDAQHNSYKIVTGYYRKPSIFTWVTLDSPVQLNIARAGLSYPDLLTLSELGVLYPTAIESAEIQIGDSLDLSYGTRRIRLQTKRRALVITYYKYTPQGEELLRLLPKANHDAFIQLLEDYYSKDFVVTQA